jgi:GGDEF domain-containing protein
VLAASVTEHPERLRPSSDLLDRLSGVAAQATTALQNGHLLEQITHRAMHDELTGLANRTRFTERFVVDGRQLEVGASIGRADFPDDASTPEDLLRVADTTMFEAKRVRRLS